MIEGKAGGWGGRGQGLRWDGGGGGGGRTTAVVKD